MGEIDEREPRAPAPIGPGAGIALCMTLGLAAALRVGVIDSEQRNAGQYRWEIGVLAGIVTALLSARLTTVFGERARAVRAPDPLAAKLAFAMTAAALVAVAWVFPGPALAAAAVLVPGYLLSLWLLPSGIGIAGRWLMAGVLGATALPTGLELAGLAGVRFSAGLVLAVSSALSAAFGGVLALRRRGGRHGRGEAFRFVLPGGSLLDAALVVSLLALGVAITLYPYIELRPAYPFGGDIQHPNNVRRLLEDGWPALQSEHLHRTYARTYWYHAAAVAALAGWSPVELFRILPAVWIVAAMLAYYWVGRAGFGSRTTGLFALLALAALSFQPRWSLLAGTHIEVVATVTLLPLYLWALSRTLAPSGARWALVAGVLGGAIVRYHFLATTIAIFITIASLFALALLRRDLWRPDLVRRLSIAFATAFVVGLPFSVYYPETYARVALGRLGLGPVVERDARFSERAFVEPTTVHFPSSFTDGLGATYAVVVALSLVVLIVLFRRRRRSTAEIVLAAWLVTLAIGTATRLFTNPVRMLWLLAMPGALLFGLAARALLRRLRSPVARVALSLLAMDLTSRSVMRVIEQSFAVARDSQFVEAADVKSLELLGSMQRELGSPYVLTDATGWWAPYFAADRAYVIPGGHGSHGWYYSRYPVPRLESLVDVLHEPCSGKSLAALRSAGVGLIYLGRPPRHWTPGWTPANVAGFVSCPAYRVQYAERTFSGFVLVMRVLPP